MMKKESCELIINRKPGIIFSANSLTFASLPRTDCHLHTCWTDGVGTCLEVYQTACDMKLDTILFSEHSRKTSTNWFNDFAAEVRNLPKSPCCAYVGTEVKVETRQGDIDTTAEIQNNCDFMMASVHRLISPGGEVMPFDKVDPRDAVQAEFDLSLAVLENPAVDILGHMFGMSLRRFNQRIPDDKIRALIKKASHYKVAVEINSHYHANPLKMIDWCREFNALISFGSNAHKLEDVGQITRCLDRAVKDA